MNAPDTPDNKPDMHNDPVFLARFVSGTRFAPLWVAARLYVGWVWLTAGWYMLQQSTWMNDGSALRNIWQTRESGTGLGIFAELASWGVADWVARVTAVGLTICGIAILLGLATGIASFTGIVLSVNVLTVETAMLGPEVFAVGMLLVLAWKSAGWIGLDRWFLPLAGAPWPGGFQIGTQAAKVGLHETHRELPH